MSTKANDALKTISEVSVLLEVPPHVLRFWEGKFNKYAISPLQIIIKTPERHKIKPIILEKLILSLKKKNYNKIMNIGDDV